VLLGVQVESLRGEAEVSSLQTRGRFERAITFDTTVASPSKFYRSFRKPFSLEYMWNCYSVSRRYRRSRPEYRFERAITFDPTVGSLSKFYTSFWKLCCLEFMWNRYARRRRSRRYRLEHASKGP